MPDMLFFRSAILSQQLQPEALPGWATTGQKLWTFLLLKTMVIFLNFI